MKITRLTAASSIVLLLMGIYTIILSQLEVGLFNGRIDSNWLLLSLFLTLAVFPVSLFFRGSEWSDLKFSSPNERKKFWLRVHASYVYLQIIDILMGLFASVLIYGFYSSQIFPLVFFETFLAIAVMFGFLYRGFLSNVFGQHYRQFGISSYIGASSLAYIARVEFEKKESRGLDYLDMSLRMLDNALQEEDLCIKNLAKCRVIIDHLSSVTLSDQLFASLTFISKEIEDIPRTEPILPKVIDTFILQTGHAEGYEVIENKQSSSFERLAIIAAILGSVGALLSVFLTDAYRSQLAGLIYSDAFLIFVIGLGIGAWLLSLRLFTQLMSIALYPWVMR